ncbi:MAG: type II toxin-antitoxin system VapC family toxin [Ilumatobacteraceae bacterium]
MIAYFDTSAIVPLIIEEATSPTCRRLWNDATRVASSRLLYPETRAALARAERLGRLTTRQLATAVGELESLIEQIDVIEVSPDIAHAAGELAQRFGLRGYDAVHLAAALAMNDDDVVLVTGDHDLASAAKAAGMATALTTV